jgi:hypothetical protein
MILKKPNFYPLLAFYILLYTSKLRNINITFEDTWSFSVNW